jgi:hypothetical protein
VRCEDHPRRAETALQAVRIPEGLLQRVQRAAASRQTFDRRDRAAVGLHGQAGARSHGDAVEQDGAGAALARIAADLGAGDAPEVANEMHQKLPRLDVALKPAAVNSNADGDFHVAPLDDLGRDQICCTRDRI